MWATQEGRCFYTNLPLTYAGDRAHSAVSIDRLNPNLGYNPSNVVLCCWGFNRIKTDFSESDLAAYCRAFLHHRGL